jgi:hypothetical protein
MKPPLNSLQIAFDDHYSKLDHRSFGPKQDLIGFWRRARPESVARARRLKNPYASSCWKAEYMLRLFPVAGSRSVAQRARQQAFFAACYNQSGFTKGKEKDSILIRCKPIEKPRIGRIKRN